MFARRLYLRIYLAVLASLAVFVLIAGLAWRIGAERWEPRREQTAQLAGELADALLPPPDAGVPALAASLARWHDRARVDLSLYAADGTLIAAAGQPLERSAAGGWSWGTPGRAGPPVYAARLPDGRELLVRRVRAPGPHLGPGLPGFLFALAAIALAVGIGAYPFVRRLTRRLERLQRSVDALGAGDLAARVKVEGRDEVASLAASFNRSAERIETLVRAQRDLLANASHELRSPLARLRMALALLPAGTPADVRGEVDRDIAELDQLIDEILLASRLQAGTDGDDARLREDVDLGGLCAEECARVGADLALQAPEAVLRGDARLLRRLVRNLLENAVRYGDGRPVEAVVARDAGGALRLEVLDRGPGVPPDERDAIFEPFYRVHGASERHGGVGLGLALARRIAERHGGTLRYQPRDGGGSRFIAALPTGAG